MMHIGVGSMGAVGAPAPKLLKAWGHRPRRIITLSLIMNNSKQVTLHGGGELQRSVRLQHWARYVIQWVEISIWFRLLIVPPYSISTSYAYDAEKKVTVGI